MIRIIGLLMCGGLLTASLWLANRTNAQEPAASEDNPFARFKSSSETEQQAQPAANPFTEQPAANPFTEQPAANPFRQASGSAPTDANRLRVQDYMKQAKKAQQAGNTAEAVRLASLASRMASAWQLSFQPNEQSPLQLLAELQGRQAPLAGGEVLAANPIPEEVPTTPEGLRDYAQQVLRAAQADIKSGRYQDAQAKIQRTLQLDVTYNVLDLRPEHVMVELARAMPAGADRPSQNLVDLNTPRTSPGLSPAQAPANAAGPTPKEQAVELVAMARQALRQGHFNEAQDLALDAQKVDTTWNLLEDRPELVLADIGRQTGSQMITADAGRTAQAVPAGNAREQALALLREARDLMAEGQLDAARERAEAVSQMDVTFNLFDDRPDLLLQDLRTAMARQPATSNSFAANSTPSAVEPEAGEPQKAHAVRLLRQAKAAIQQGDLQSAHGMIAQAEQIDVAYDLFDETPEKLREELTQAMAAQSPVPGNPVASNGGVMRADALEGANVPQEPAFELPEGASALELFNIGVDQLRTGNRRGAYAAFLQAHNSGEKLDPYRHQQLQDKLRELRPRTGNIMQASNESYEPSLLPTPNGNVVDAAMQEQAVKFDRLRAETLNAMTKADRLREKQPEEALAVIDATLESIAQSDLGEERTGALSASLRSTRSSIESYMRMKAPIFEQERKNAEVKAVIQRDLETRNKIEQDLAVLVDQYNELMDQKRFSEAHALALQAKELDSKNHIVVQMELQSQFAIMDARNSKLKSDKEHAFIETLFDVEQAAISNVGDAKPMAFAENWSELKERRKAQPTDARERSEAEQRVYQSLQNPVSLHFDNVPLAQVMKYVADTQGINIRLDSAGLTEEGITDSTPVSISVDGIRLRSALNLILQDFNLDYAINNEVLVITSKLRQQGELITSVYQVADLVIPVSAPSSNAAFQHASNFTLGGSALNAQQSIPSYPALGGQGMMQVPANPLSASIPQLNGNTTLQGPAPSNAQFQALSELITTTISPDSWQEVGAAGGSITQHDSTLSLVIRQTQKVHQEIADLLDQLRRLQDVQVTVEVRYITVTERFFEQIGIDFDFNVNDTVGGPAVDNNFNPLRPFGSVDPTNGAAGGAGNQAGQAGGGQGGQGGQAGQGGGGATNLAPFTAQPSLNFVGRDNWPAGTVVGLLNNTQTMSPELDIPFRQGSFDIAQPTFGGFDANAGIQFGMAILSDIEAFAFVRAAQGDKRSNVLIAPKITLFNGQLGNVTSALQRPFVISLAPVASTFNIGFQPQIQTLNDGTSLTVRAVVSADRRYVRLMLLPVFTNITDVFTFSFVSGGGIGGAAGGGGGGLGGGGLGGGGGGLGGGGGGGGLGGGGGGGQNGNNRNQAAGNVTVQQPVQNIVTVDTVVSVPDGGTVLLGGVKNLKEGRNMAGVPILNKIPYISRLFKNTGVGRETESLMLMVTPRIIIQEEEEQLLGL